MQISHNGSGDRLVADAKRAFQDGMLPAKIFNHAGLHELELERIFARAWIFVGHAS